MNTEAIDRKTGEITQQREAAAPVNSGASELQRLLDREYDARAMLDGDSMDKMLRMAEVMADGKTTVPKHLQGSVGDCMAVVTQAMAWGMNPFAVAQKTHLVNGTLGYEAQLVIAVINSSRLLATRLNYRWSETNWGGINGKSDASDAHFVEVWATLRGETEPRVLKVSMAQVGKVRNSPNWEADPRQQIGYLAAKRWARLHTPDVVLGVYTPDELDEIPPAAATPADLPRNAKPAQVAAVAAAQTKPERTAAHTKLIEELEHKAFKEGTEGFRLAWEALPKADRAALGIEERDRIKAIGVETDKMSAGGVQP